MDIGYSTASDQWHAFAVVLIFFFIMGLLAGGLWEQLTRKPAEEKKFWPTSFKKIVWSSMIAGILGAWIGSEHALKPVYKIVCSESSVLLWHAARSQAEAVDIAQITEVNRRLVSAGGGDPWAIRIYTSEGHFYETTRISDRRISKELGRVRKCVSTL